MAPHISARRLGHGAVAGAIASIAMGLYAMLASLIKDTGFFTPLYHIASSVSSPDAMMTSMPAAMENGDAFTFLAGPAALGLAIHMMIGALAGVVFALLTGFVRLSTAMLVVAGAVFGLLLMAVNSLVLLPVTARLFGGGDAIANMGSMAGWTTFTVEHVLYGLVLGLLLAVMTRTGRTERTGSGTTVEHPGHAHR